MSKLTLVLFGAVLAFILVTEHAMVQGAALESFNKDDASDDDVREYLGFLEDYLQQQQHEGRSKRGRFCLARDMTCPNLPNGKDVCCRGSQCSCNIFNQNCKCSTLGLFQRLG